MKKRSEQMIMQNWKRDTDNPILSIDSITYNHEKYIAKAIEGFLMQETDFPFEILINEDCSTDNTASIIKEFEKNYPNIIKPIYQKENQYSKGVEQDFNFPRAKGKYIALCEGDDYWTDPLKLQKQVDFLEKNDEYILSYHKTRKVNEEGVLITDEVDAVNHDLDADQLKCAEEYIQTCTVVFRHIPLKPTDELKKAYNGDAVLWHLLSFHGKSKYLQNVGYSHYRIHSGGLWSKLDLFEKYLESTNTRLAIMNNLKNDKVLQKRMERKILYNFSIKLFDSVSNRETEKIGKLFHLMNNAKQIKTYKFIKAFSDYSWIMLKNKVRTQD